MREGVRRIIVFSAVLLRAHSVLAGFLALMMFVFTAFSLLYIDTDKSTKYSFRYVGLNALPVLMSLL